MAASVVQSKTGAESGSETLPPPSTVTVTWDTPATAGNLLVVTAATDDYVIAGGIPAGFTESTGCRQHTFLGHYVWWKVATGGETSTTYTIGSNSPSCWATAEITGIAPAPYDISAGQFNQTSGTSYTTPAITPSAGDRFLLASMGQTYSATQLTGVSGWLNGFVEVADVFTVRASGTRDLTSLASLGVTANGSTAYSTGASYNPGASSRTGIIAAFKVAASGGGTDANVTPSPVAATAAVPSSSRSAGSTVAAAVVAAAVGILAPQIQATSNATVTATPLAVAAGVPVPQVASGSSATVTPAVIATTATAPGVDLATGAQVAPVPVAAAASVLAVAVSTSITATPALVPVVASVPGAAVATVVADITVRVGPPRRAWAATPPGRGWQIGPPIL